MSRESVRKVDYWYTVVPDRPGAARDVLEQLSARGVNLMACLAFPREGGKSQVDMIPEDPAAFEAAAQAAQIPLSKRKQALLLEGVDRPGALAAQLDKVAAAGINCTAASAIATEGGNYGFLLWVKPESIDAAAAALSA